MQVANARRSNTGINLNDHACLFNLCDGPWCSGTEACLCFAWLGAFPRLGQFLRWHLLKAHTGTSMGPRSQGYQRRSGMSHRLIKKEKEWRDRTGHTQGNMGFQTSFLQPVIRNATHMSKVGCMLRKDQSSALRFPLWLISRMHTSRNRRLSQRGDVLASHLRSGPTQM